MHNKIQCSVGILTFNSGETLGRALNSVRDFSEIIICDGGSTDDTLNIAREYGCKIIFQDRRFKNTDNTIKNFSGIRNQCLDAATYDWFLYVDSDEAISPELRDDIQGIVDVNTDIYVYFIPIKMFVGDRMIKYSCNYPGYQSRFFNKKSGARFIKEVHERINYNKNKFISKKLDSPWYVYWTEERVKNYSKYSNKYIDIEIRIQGKQSLLVYFRYAVLWNIKNIINVIIKSFRNYIFYGFKDSMPLRVEFGRVVYFLKLIYRTTINQVKIRIKHHVSLGSIL